VPSVSGVQMSSKKESSFWGRLSCFKICSNCPIFCGKAVGDDVFNVGQGNARLKPSVIFRVSNAIMSHCVFFA